MWHRSDLEAGCDFSKSGSSVCPPGWVPGLNNLPTSRNRIHDGSRQSTVSDSGDTGIGTYCSDGVEEDCCPATSPLSLQTVSQHHMSLNEDDDGPPIGLVSPYSSSSYWTPHLPRSTGHWSGSCPLNMASTPPVGVPGGLEMKDLKPLRRSSSFTKLSSATDKSSSWASVHCYGPGIQGSLDRGLLYGSRLKNKGSKPDLYLPVSSSRVCSSLLLRSPGANPGHRYHHCGRSNDLTPDLLLSSAHSSPAKQNSLGLSYAALPESRPSVGGRQVSSSTLSNQADLPLAHSFDSLSPIQPAVRTQMWLTEQMEHKPLVDDEGEPGLIHGSRTEGSDLDGLSSWHQELNQISLPVSILVKVKEGLLRQRELEINRQKLQILQLHARIRENELRVKQVLQSQRGLFEDSLILNIEESALRRPCQQPSDSLCYDEDFGRKLLVAELEVLYLNKFFNQINQKYTEDIRKLEEKIKTRDRYITSLKKKCQRECEQNQDKQQRIETLEKYLSDMPSLEEVQVQFQQQEESQQKAQDLEKTVSRLQKRIEDECALLRKKDLIIDLQARREKEMIASVHSLQEKVQHCLDDGVRLPVQDLKRLEVENSQLLQQQDHSSRLLRLQREEIDRLTSRLTSKSVLAPLSSGVRVSEVDQLLKEMSLCLLDLQGLCSILSQRAQGKQPSLSLLLGMESFGVSADNSECKAGEEDEEELSFKLLEVNRLRRDIDELRRNISERCAQHRTESCPTGTP
uniref:Centrosomal protein 85kDa-like n=1 Tax=Nothobranchius rachovii TaxID=451742 RepID=A0A1A8SG30_9TELE